MMRRRKLKGNPRIDPCRPPSVPCDGNTATAPGTLREIVDDYIRGYRRDAGRELEFFRTCPTLRKAVEYAALAKLPSNKRHPHQRRIPGEVLRQAELDLQTTHDSLQACKTFTDLHHLVEREIGQIHGIGKLMIYDVAHRIGAFLGLEPDRVYLHGSCHRRKGIRSPVPEETPTSK